MMTTTRTADSGAATASILIIEDEPVLGKNMLHYLQRCGYEVRLAATALEGLAEFEALRPDAVVLDYKLPDMDGIKVLERLHAFDTSARVLMVTGHGSIDLAVEAMKAGAYDFVTKPVSLGQIKLRLEQAIGDARRDRVMQYYRSRDEDPAALDELLGESPPMLALKRTIAQLLDAESKLIDAEAPAVLVLGETGSGKEVLARALHQGGPRRDKPFVELNCAALPVQLLESELFGHERGAFTDARERKLGLVETAEGGTLFLDEIGDMDLALQAKLLKLLEEKTVRRLGSVREQRVSVRIVAATHRPLEALVQEGKFRADLFYRLRVVELSLPPLRERGEDILMLARHFIAQHARRYAKPPPELSASASAAMLAHAWPGNVRELRNALEQTVLLGRGPQITAQDLPITTSSSALAAQSSPPAPERAHASVQPVATTLPQMERQALLRALQFNGWNVSRAARALGISRDTLRYRIDKHGLEADMSRPFVDSQS